MSDRIGFIGLGNMGLPMARNLLAAGYALTVHNRSRGAVEVLAKEGATPAGSSKEVAERSDVIVTMLPDTPDVEAVVLGPGGVIEGARPGSVLIDMSTILPSAGRAVAARLGEREVEMLDAPVSGGPQGAEAATLSIMVGGPEEAFERCLPVLQALGRAITRIGEHGAGHTAKLCNQVACVVNLQGVCETLVLAAKAGLDVERVRQAVGAGAGASWMLTVQGEKMVERDFAPGFFVRLQQKDLRLIMAAADELGLPLPVTSLVQQMFKVLEAEGKGELGTQALALAMERIAGCEIAPPDRGSREAQRGD